MRLSVVHKALTPVPQNEQKGSLTLDKWACVDSGWLGFFLVFIIFTSNKELSWLAQVSLPTQLNTQGFYKSMAPRS